jgi:histidinol-phosphatase
MNPPDPRLALALEAAREAGAAALRYSRMGIAHQVKGDGSPVTIADREGEQIIRRRIAAAFPDDAIVGEELGSAEGDSGWRWFIDPIDGTKSFIRGVPLWGTLIGLEYGGRIVAGVAEYPALGQTLHASRGEGAWLTEAGRTSAARVSAVQTLEESLLCATSASGFQRRGEAAWEAYGRLCRVCRTVRGWGDCYGWGLVAMGRAELMVDTHVRPWDVAPFAVILEEAGGMCTDWAGQSTIHGGTAVASNGRVLGAALGLLRPGAG